MTEWRYEIQYGPEGEANYAWVYKGNDMIATMKTHHAIEVVKALSASPAGVTLLKRYEPVSVCSEPDMHERENGDWVRYDDVARIMSAIEQDGVGVETEDVDRLPKGHVILEQADMIDGRVSQTVRAADGSEYERIVHANEAYGEDE